MVIPRQRLGSINSGLIKSSSISSGTKTLWSISLWCAVVATAAFWPFALNRWVLPKDVVLGIAALLGIWIVPRGHLPRWLLIILAAGIAILTAAALNSELPINSLLGRWPRYEGLISGFAYLLALWLGARLLGPSSTGRERRHFTIAIATLSLIIGVVSLLESLGLRPLSTDLSRPGSLLGNATDQGTIGAACVLLLALPALRLRQAVFKPSASFIVIGLGFGLLTVVIAASRASLLALILGLAIIGLREIMIRTKRNRSVAVVVSTLVGVVTLALLSPALGPRLLSYSRFGSSTVGDRVVIWNESFQLWLAHPWLGVGPSGFSSAIAGVHDATWFNTVGQSVTLDSPHNVLIQAFVVGGPLLALGLVIAVTMTIRATVKKVRLPAMNVAANSARPGSFDVNESKDFSVAAGVALLAIIVVLLTHVTSPGTIILGALLAGALVSEVSVVSVAPVLPVLPEISAGTTLRSPRWKFLARLRPSERLWRLLLSGTIVCWLAFVGTGLAAEVSLSDGRQFAFVGDLNSATAAFERASALRPWDVDTTITAAESLTARLDKGDNNALAPSLFWAKLALTQAPNSFTAAQASVTADLAAGNLIGAKTTLERFRNLMPQQPWIAHRRAVVMLLEGDLVGAESQLLQAISLNETNADPWLTLAYVYREQGRSADAAKATTTAQSFTP